MNETQQAPALRWVICPPPDEEKVARLVAELQLPHALAALLVQRGHETPDAARRFLRPSLTELSDPYRLLGMHRAVETMRREIDDQSKAGEGDQHQRDARDAGASGLSNVPRSGRPSA